MGGNYLPPLTETDQLSNLQMSGCVSLALPNTGSPATQRHKMWADVATDFSSKAYNPDEAVCFRDALSCGCYHQGVS